MRRGHRWLPGIAWTLAMVCLARDADAGDEPATTEPATAEPATAEGDTSATPPPGKPKREMPAEWSEPTPTPPKRRWSPHMPLVGGGLVSFAAGYIPALGVAIASFVNKLVTSGGGIGGRGDEGGAMVLAVPVGGPFFFAASDAGDGLVNREGLSGEGKALLYTSGLLQAGGVVAIGVGFAMGKEIPLRVAPLGAPGVAGLSFAIDRW